MTFFDLIATRQSGRSYAHQAVEKEKLIKIVEAGAIAPSACNSQPWRFIVVGDLENAAKVATLTQKPDLPINRFTDKCGAFIVICESPAMLIGRTEPDQKYAQMDIGITTAHMALAATELGLDNCILGSFQEEPLRELLNIPAELQPRLILAVGYGEKNPLRPKKRLALTEIAHFEKW